MTFVKAALSRISKELTHSRARRLVQSCVPGMTSQNQSTRPSYEHLQVSQLVSLLKSQETSSVMSIRLMRLLLLSLKHEQCVLKISTNPGLRPILAEERYLLQTEMLELLRSVQTQELF